MSFRVDAERIGPDGIRLSVAYGAEPASFADVFGAWAQSPEFALLWSQALADLPFQACSWELPGLVRSELGRPFECVCLDHPSLARAQPDRAAFAEHWTDAPVVRFTNLRGDSTLVVPVDRGDAFAHLLAFARSADDARLQALWHAVGGAVRELVGKERVWTSTAGMGVHWLHVRLDPRPKYYRYGPYRSDSMTAA